MPLLSRLRRSRRFHLLVSPPPVSSLNEVVVAVESGREDKTLIGCVLGSAGPIWFVVNEEELVATVIDTALKAYAREGRLPVQNFESMGNHWLTKNAHFHVMQEATNRETPGCCKAKWRSYSQGKRELEVMDQ